MVNYLTDPPLWFVHFALFISSGVVIGVGTVIGSLGLAGTNPVVFAFLRNIIVSSIAWLRYHLIEVDTLYQAWPFLVGISWCSERATIKRKHFSMLVLAAWQDLSRAFYVRYFFYDTQGYGNEQWALLSWPQADGCCNWCCVASLHTCVDSDVSTAAEVLHTTTTACICNPALLCTAIFVLRSTRYASLIGWEKVTLLKLFGMILAFAGACVVLFVGVDLKSGDNLVMGNMFYFLNVSGSKFVLVYVTHVQLWISVHSYPLA
jgi:hypothetical protein